MRVDDPSAWLTGIGGWLCSVTGLLLAIVLIALVVSVVLLWRKPELLTPRKDRELLQRFNDGQCLHCGYDLRGSTNGVCPECGKSSFER